jgi:hypothetical protein
MCITTTVAHLRRSYFAQINTQTRQFVNKVHIIYLQFISINPSVMGLVRGEGAVNTWYNNL